MRGELERVFVYGTLRRGERLAPVMAGGHFSEDAMATGLVLRDLGPFPIAVRAPGFRVVVGELHRVGADLLDRLDRIEGVPNLYRRERVALVDGTDAWAYVWAGEVPEDAPAIPSGDWVLRETRGRA